MSNGISYTARGKQRDAYRSMLEGKIRAREDLLVHFVFNREVTLEAATSSFDEYHQRTDRRTLGKKFHKKPPSARSSMIVFVEHPDGNLHGHGFMRPCKFRSGESILHYMDECQRIWKAIEPAGNLKIEKVTHPKSAIVYVTKDLVRPGAADMIYIQGQF